MPLSGLMISLLIFFLINSAFSIEFYDPNVPQEVFFTSKSSSPQQYGLFITAQAVFEANFFRFGSIPTEFPSLISISELTSVNQDVILTYQNILTEQQATDLGINTGTCVTETVLDCTVSSVPSLCGILAPTPSQDGILKIQLGNLDCTTGNSNSLCQLSLNNTSLKNLLEEDVFVSSDVLCPNVPIKINVIVPVLRAYINAPYIADQGKLTFHYLTTGSVDSSFWAMTGSLDRFGEPSEVCTNSTQPLVVISDDNSTEVAYKTIIKTRLMRHNHTADLYCRYQLDYTGIIRGIFINEYPSGVHAPSGIGLETETHVESTTRLQIKANQLNYVSIFGYNMTKTDLTFIDCQAAWTEDVVPSIPVEFSTYSYGDPVADSEDVQIQGTTYGCGGDCLVCSDRGTCVKCSTHLFLGRCDPKCPGEFPVSDYKGICNTFFQSGAVLLEAYDPDSGKTNITFYNDYEMSNPYALVMYAMDQVLLGPTPLVWLSGATLFAESIVTFIPSLQYGINEIQTSVSTPDASVVKVYLPSDTTLNPGEVQARYYPLLSSSTFAGFTWDLNGLRPSISSDQVNPDESFTIDNGGYIFSEPTSFHVFQAFLNCVTDCEIQVRSDGRVQLFKNDETLMFDVTFKSLWTYVYPNVTGFISIKFVVTGASYFQSTAVGGQLYGYDTTFFSHDFNLPNASTSATTILNCLNNQEDICLSCQENYFLLSNKSACTANCPTGYFPSVMERTCKQTCSAYELFNTALSKCQPKCDQLGYYFKDGQGCILCVPECATCSTDGKCLQCRYSDPANNSTYCARKKGTLYALKNFGVSQTISFPKDTGVDLAVVVADQSIIDGQLFYFDNAPRKVPRIMKAFKMQISGSAPEMAGLTLPAISMPQSGTITVHYVKIVKDTTFSKFSISAFREKGFMEWPMTETLVPQVDTSLAQFVYDDKTAIPLTVEKYATIVGTRLYKHNQPGRITCQLQVSYMGNLRGLYANGDLLLTGTTEDERTESTSISRQFIFEANELLMMSFVGYRLTVTDLTFMNCVNLAGTSVSPVLESYLMTGFDAYPDDFVVTNSTACSSSCKRCIDATRCLRCDTNHYLVNGACQSKCSADQQQIVFGYCSSEGQNQGFRYYSGYADGPNSLKVEYVLPFNIPNLKVLAIAHPFEVYPTSHIAYAFIPDSTPSFTEGSYLLKTFVGDELMLVSEFSIRLEATNEYENNDFLIYTIRPDLALLYYYSQPPTTINDLLDADGFAYVSLTSQPILVQKSNRNFLDLFIDCTGNCAISFELGGNIKVLLNERTYLFEGYVESFVGEVTLSRIISGLNHLVIEFWNTTNFTLGIQGTYNILALGDFVAQKHLRDTIIELCTAQNCLNCYQDKCISCIEGYFLDPTSQCVQVCPGGTMGDPFERVCKTIDCSSATAISTLVKRDDICIWNCIDAPGFYYEVSTGCTSPCNSPCQICSGPLASQCLLCPSPAQIIANGSCICPGNTDTSTGECHPSSSISLQIESFALSCNTVQLNAEFDVEVFDNAKFFWEIVSSTGSAILKNLIQNFLSSQNSSQVNLPKTYLEEQKTYNFTAYYFDHLNNKFQAWTILTTFYDQLPDFTIEGGNLNEWRIYMSHTIQAKPNGSECLTSKLNATWTVVSGSLANSDLLFFPSFPLQAIVPSCKLPFNSSVTLKATIWNNLNTAVLSDQVVEIKTLPETFRALLSTDDHDHPENVDLKLDGIIDYYDNCPTRQQGDIYYWWTCSNVTDGLDCLDSDAFFNIKRSTSELIIPENTFDNGQVLEFRFFVEKNEVVQNSTLTISFKSSNTFIMDADAQPDCRKYATNKDCIITAVIKSNQYILTREDYQTLTFNWQATPSVPYAFFQDKMKLLSSQTILPATTQSLRVEFRVMNGTHNGLSYLSLPINRPPSGGTIAISPSVGVSLTTYFTISAHDWQDDDVPLAYQYSYSFVEDDNYAPILYPYTSVTDVVTILPSQYTGTPVYVRVDVRDFLGAETIAEATVQVNPDTKTTQQKIQQYNDMLDSIGDPGSLSSGIIISTVSKAISELEKQLSQGVSQPVCPVCSNHGTCPLASSRCQCTAGWNLADCSVQQSVVDSIVDLKEKYLEELVESYNNAINQTKSNPSEYQDVYQLIQENYQQALLEVLKDASQDPYFNTNSSLTSIQQILEDTLKVFDPNTTLSVPDQVKTLSEILSSMLTFVATKDCAGNTQFTKDLSTKLIEYLQKISESILSQKITNENATIISTDNIDMYFEKLSLCDLQNKTISTGTNAPTISLNLDPSVPLNCSTEYNLEYYAFNDNLLNCSKNPSTDPNKTIIGINISDPNTGANANIPVSIIIQPLPQCPSVCHRLPNGACACDNISPFDVKDQIIKMFEQSNVLKLLQIEAILQFQFWKSISFWGVTVFTIVFAINLFIVKRLATYNRIEQFKHTPLKTKGEIFWNALLITHPLLSIHNTIEPHLSKKIRAILFFTRNILLLALTSAFSEPSETPTFIGEFSDFDMYLFLLPFFTVIPICFLMTWMVKTPSIKNGPSEHKNLDFASFFLKIKTRIGYTLLALLFIISFLIIFIIDANENNLERLSWTVDFIKSTLQDLFLNPLFDLLYQYLAIKAYEHEFFRKHSKLHKIVGMTLEESLIEMKETLDSKHVKSFSSHHASVSFPFQKSPTYNASNSNENFIISPNSSTSDNEKILFKAPESNMLQQRKSSIRLAKPPTIQELSFEDSIYKHKTIDVSNIDKSEQKIAPLDLESMKLPKASSKVFPLKPDSSDESDSSLSKRFLHYNRTPENRKKESLNLVASLEEVKLDSPESKKPPMKLNIPDLTPKYNDNEMKEQASPDSISSEYSGFSFLKRNSKRTSLLETTSHIRLQIHSVSRESLDEPALTPNEKRPGYERLRSGISSKNSSGSSRKDSGEIKFMNHYDIHEEEIKLDRRLSPPKRHSLNVQRNFKLNVEPHPENNGKVDNSEHPEEKNNEQFSRKDIGQKSLTAIPTKLTKFKKATIVPLTSPPKEGGDVFVSPKSDHPILDSASERSSIKFNSRKDTE